MFDNIGSKIKSLATVICWVGIIASIIAAIALFVGSEGEGTLIGMGFGCLIGGPLVSWISCMFTYGFGELIEKVTEIAKNTGSSTTTTCTPKSDDKRLAELEKWRVEGLISEEDYDKKKETIE